MAQKTPRAFKQYVASKITVHYIQKYEAVRRPQQQVHCELKTIFRNWMPRNSISDRSDLMSSLTLHIAHWDRVVKIQKREYSSGCLVKFEKKINFNHMTLYCLRQTPNVIERRKPNVEKEQAV